jgi:hypothetical protein
MSTAAVFLDIEKTFDTKWRSGLPYKLSELESSTTLVELIASFLNDRNCKFLIESEYSTQRKIAARAPPGSVPAPMLYRLYINDAPEATGTHLAL